MLRVCRFLDDPLNLKAFAPASARALECPKRGWGATPFIGTTSATTAACDHLTATQ